MVAALTASLWFKFDVHLLTGLLARLLGATAMSLLPLLAASSLLVQRLNTSISLQCRGSCPSCTHSTESKPLTWMEEACRSLF